MQRLKKGKSKKFNNLDCKSSGKSIRSDNIHVPLTPSVFQKIRPSISRESKTRSRPSTGREKYVEDDVAGGSPTRLSRAPSDVQLPENVAVHFASFYRGRRAELPHCGDEKPGGIEKGSRNSPKMEFTRQMVYKLEHSAGTQDYGRQVSTLLENTVESPGFDLRLPPADNCAPQIVKSRGYFPLWYRDPSKMPFEPSRSQRYRKSKNLMEKCEEFIEGKGRGDRKTLESSTGSSSNSDTEVKLDTEAGSESEEVGMRNSRIKYDRGIIGSAKSHLSTSSRSGITRRFAGDSGPAKRRDNLRLYSVDSKTPISESFSTHSWSSVTSRGTGAEKEDKEEEEEEDEEDSVNWETTEDEDEDAVEVKVKVVCDSQKIAFRSEALTG